MAALPGVHSPIEPDKKKTALGSCCCPNAVESWQMAPGSAAVIAIITLVALVSLLALVALVALVALATLVTLATLFTGRALASLLALVTRRTRRSGHGDRHGDSRRRDGNHGGLLACSEGCNGKQHWKQHQTFHVHYLWK
jgi:uncharacterized membrane protein YgcG